MVGICASEAKRNCPGRRGESTEGDSGCAESAFPTMAITANKPRQMRDTRLAYVRKGLICGLPEGVAGG